MQSKLWFYLLLLAIVGVLTTYSCFVAVPIVLPAEKTNDRSNYTYHYSVNNITDIQIVVEKATVNFYCDAKQKEIVVQTMQTAAEVTMSEKVMLLSTKATQECQIDIYLPERFYSVVLIGKDLQVRTYYTMRGTMQMEADILQAEMNGYCGSFSIRAKKGNVKIENGKVQKTSHITLTETGNIYLNTKVTDVTGISSFSTANGFIKVQTNFLTENTKFIISALTVFGEYVPLEAIEQKNNTYCKVKLNAENGIVIFEHL